MDLCRHIKNNPSQRHIRVVLTAGLLEPFDEAEATRAGCDAILKKPFEASKVMETIHPLVKDAQLARAVYAETMAAAAAASAPPRSAAPPSAGRRSRANSRSHHPGSRCRSPHADP